MNLGVIADQEKLWNMTHADEYIDNEVEKEISNIASAKDTYLEAYIDNLDPNTFIDTHSEQTVIVDNTAFVKKALVDLNVIVTAKQDALALDNDNLTAYMMYQG